MGDKQNLSLEEQLKQGLIEPGQPIKFNQNIELQFQESVIDDLKEQNKSFILTESKGGASQKRKLMVTVEGIHTGMTKNLTFYPGTTLESSVPTWTTPHEKPVIKNHNSYAEPLGRIVHAEYVESTLTDKYTVRLKLEITDQDAIEKILDKRYLTLSVGGSAKRVNCSICSKDLVSEGWCGHSRGRKYEGKQAHWTINDYTGDEISFVNMPADVHSQVIAVELVTAEGGENVKDGKKSKESTEENAPQGISTTESDADIIDNLLNEGDDNSDTTTVQTQENDQPEGEPNPENPTEDNDGDAGTEETLEEKVSRLETELGESKTALKKAEDDLATAQAENVTLAAERDQLKTDMSEMTQQKESAEEEAKTFKEQNLKLARFARKSMAERVVDLRILQGKEAKDADREALVTEWVGSSSKVLESTIQDLLSQARTVTPVQNPGLPIPDKNSVTEDDNGNPLHTEKKPTEKSEKPKLQTMKDLSESMISVMSRGNDQY